MPPLLIQTTGLEDYAPGGTARVKVLLIGGPGAGKTRWSSFFPKPIYADCEKGLASVADRNVPYVTVRSSQDMLDLLTHLKQECRQPVEQRKYETLVVDTLDAFQRKVKNEWMELNRKEVFTGWEAWGYLNAKMQLLMTRLLNLDMNVVVAVHYKDRTTKDDETGKESHELMLQLQGELSDTAFNDFDLVGWIGTFWEPVDGQRVQKRGLTFKPKPDRPFLKDRLHVTPDWMEVKFAESDYTNLFEAIQARVEEMDASQVLGEVPPATDQSGQPGQPVAYVPTGAIGSGPLPAAPAKEIPYAQLDKPTLAKKCRDLGITTTTDGAPIKTNTLKGELIAALEAHDAAPAAPAAQATPDPVQPAPDTGTDAPPTPVAAVVTPASAKQPEPANGDTTSAAPKEALDRYAAAANPARTQLNTNVRTVPEGKVDVVTGELVEPTLEQASATVTAQLGGTVIEDKVVPVAPKEAPSPVTPPAEQVCDDCGKSLVDQRPDIVKIGYIRFRKRLCEDHYAARKNPARQ